MPIPHGYCTVRDASEKFGLHQGSIRNLLSQGKLASSRHNGLVIIPEQHLRERFEIAINHAPMKVRDNLIAKRKEYFKAEAKMTALVDFGNSIALDAIKRIINETIEACALICDSATSSDPEANQGENEMAEALAHQIRVLKS